MERNFYNDDFDFEQFLKQKADQYKMYPSDRVWNNINNSLRGRRRWFIGGLMLLLLGTAGLVTNEILLDNYQKLANELNRDVPISRPYFFDDNTIGTDAVSVNKNSIYPESNKSQVTVRVPAPVVPILAAVRSPYNNNIPEAIAISEPTAFASEIESGGSTFINNQSPVNHSGQSREPELNRQLAVSSNTPEIIDPLEMEEEQPARNLWMDLIQREALIKEKRKWSLTMYASPIISYRKLTNINRTAEFTPVAINFSDNIDGYVDHKPAVGFELGTKAQYNLSRSLMIQAGLQLNHSRYSIRAYKSFSEKATIALGRAPGSDTVASYTSIRNFEGNSPEQLQNQYLQLSVPIGAEMVLLGKRRLQLSVAASLQPSYLLSNNSFLISTDYKNYVQKPDLARRWNLHTNVEAFVSYKANGLRWQVGPQFRHQTLSSYSNQYPIREYITEFGFKLGVSKTIR